jgi:hypothetical protein
MVDPEEIEQAVDVYVDAPVVNVDEIKFELDDLTAHVAVLAEAGRFVELNVGVGVRLGKVKLDIKGVETQALLEARLHNVTAILARVLTTLDRNPELLKSVGEALGDVGGGARDLLSDTGDVVQSAGKAPRARSATSVGGPVRASPRSAAVPSRASRAWARSKHGKLDLTPVAKVIANAGKRVAKTSQQVSKLSGDVEQVGKSAQKVGDSLS